MNILDISNKVSENETLVKLVENKKVRIEQIVSTGQTSDWYDQVEDEFVILLEGCATITYEDDSDISLVKGDTLYIPAHTIHRVSYTSISPACIWLCVFWENE